MIEHRIIADPHARYGARRASTRDFILQRLTGMANILFLLFFVWFVVRLAGGGRAEMAEVAGHPLVGLVLALLVVNVAIHMRIGMKDIIEDYVHEPRTNRLALLLNTMFALGVALVGTGAILKLVFWS